MMVVDTLEQFAQAREAVVIDLADPAALAPAEFARALADHTGPAPVLRVSPAWLRAADVALRGDVAEIVGPGSSPSVALLAATLGQA